MTEYQGKEYYIKSILIILFNKDREMIPELSWKTIKVTKKKS